MRWLPFEQRLARLGNFAVFASAVAWRIVTPPWNAGEFFRHTWIIATRCLAPVLAVTFPFGMVLALQGLEIFNLFGAQRLLPSLISVAVLRELAPVLTSVLVAAQGGSAFAAELGAMRIKEELDATEIMATDAIRWHVAPRVVALVAACPFLYLAGSIAGLFGGFVMAVGLQGENAGVYMDHLWKFCAPIDLVGGITKSVVFGALIGLIACWHGFYSTGGAAGVGRSVNDTVVQSTLTFFVANYLLTTAFFSL